MKYEQPETQKQFGNLATLTKDYCEKLLAHTSVKGMVQSRVKKCDSLKEKLQVPGNFSQLGNSPNVKAADEAAAEEADEPQDAHADIYDEHGEVPSVRDWIRKRGNIYKHPEIGDLAGVRIGLFFPDDVVKVALEIEKQSKIKHRWGTVRDGRTATQERNLDPQKHSINGAWVSPGTNHQWEHYGYKSWQVVAQWKRKSLEVPQSVQLLGDSEILRSQMPKGFKSLRIEIQVGTVVTQAWAEVQHNIIYKRSDGLMITPTMERTIDAMNGLAITTDIMLKELRRCLTEQQRKWEENYIYIANVIELLPTKARNQMNRKKRLDWVGHYDTMKLDFEQIKMTHKSNNPERKPWLSDDDLKRFIDAMTMLLDKKYWSPFGFSDRSQTTVLRRYIKSSQKLTCRSLLPLPSRVRYITKVRLRAIILPKPGGNFV